MMPYAADHHGRPVFFISSMAMHTQNLQDDRRASLLITQPDIAGDPLGAARVTLLGEVREVPATEVRDLYLSRYENAAFWQDYTDFAYYRLETAGVYFIGGFGVMGWVPAKDYSIAQPDPLAEAAPGIIRHVNRDHAEALRVIARYYAHEDAGEAAMTAVDRLGFHLRLKSGAGGEDSRRRTGDPGGNAESSPVRRGICHGALSARQSHWSSRFSGQPPSSFAAVRLRHRGC
jgi:putative heme iron utilization protein